MKKCIKCGKQLSLDQFYERKFKSGITGHQSSCKDCWKAASTVWQKNNPEKVRKKNTRWQKNNSEKARKRMAGWRKANLEKERTKNTKWRKENPEKFKAALIRWRKNNPEKVRAMKARHISKRRANDLNFRMMANIRSAIYIALRNNIKSGRTAELLGCSIEHLRQYLENQFTGNMSWDNYGRYGWHIDHIIPLSYFDFSDPEQQKRAWHYTNLQPLWAADNLGKSNKIEERQLVLL